MFISRVVWICLAMIHLLMNDLKLSASNGLSVQYSAVFQDPAVALAKKGYHILLEKPMAVSGYMT